MPEDLIHFPVTPVALKMAVSIGIFLLIALMNVRSIMTDKSLEITTSAALMLNYPLGVLVALGRKNFLFAGSQKGAQHIAMIYSLHGTCKLHSINPYDWLKDILCRINSHPISKITALLPYNWKQNHCK